MTVKATICCNLQFSQIIIHRISSFFILLLIWIIVFPLFCTNPLIEAKEFFLISCFWNVTITKSGLSIRQFKWRSITWNTSKTISLLFTLNHLSNPRLIFLVNRLVFFFFHSIHLIHLGYNKLHYLSLFFSQQCYFCSNLSLFHLFYFLNIKLVQVLPSYPFDKFNWFVVDLKIYTC